MNYDSLKFEVSAELWLNMCVQLDGWIARRYPSQQSAFGSFMDPLADKLLIGILFVTLTMVHLIPGIKNYAHNLKIMFFSDFEFVISNSMATQEVWHAPFLSDTCSLFCLDVANISSPVHSKSFFKVDSSLFSPKIKLMIKSTCKSS